MSMSGSIHLYVEQFPTDLEAAFFRIADWSGSETVRLICQGTPVLEGDTLAGDAAIGFATHELIANQASVRTFWSYYRSDSVLNGTFVKSPRVSELVDAFVNGIDPKIRGTFMPQDLVVSVGQFRLIDVFKNEGEVVGLPCLEVHFFGYGIPDDWAATRTQLQALPQMVKFQRELTAVMQQDVKIEAIWDC